MPAPTITALPAAPQRTDLPSEFSNKADAFVAALGIFRTEINALGSWMDTTGSDIDTQHAEATAAASTATTAANTATTKANEASSSASSASTSESNASDSAILSASWAEGVGEVVPGQYSAKYWATEAESVILSTIIDDGSVGTDRAWSASKLTTEFGNYVLSSSPQVTNWNTAYGWGNHASAGYALETRTITAGTGLSGGGSLAANRTINVTFGSGAGTAAQGNDSRINNGQTAYSWGNHATAGYAGTGSQVFSGNVTAASFITSNWTIDQSGSDLIFKYNGVNKAKLSSTGVFTAADFVIGGV